MRGNTLLKLDGIIRRAVKAWLNLPTSICNGLLDARPRDGGLGVMKLSSAIPAIQVKRLFRLTNSADETTRHTVRASGVENDFQMLWAKAGGVQGSRLVLFPEGGNSAPPAARAVCPVPCNWRRGEAELWGALPVQGVGYHFFWAVWSAMRGLRSREAVVNATSLRLCSFG